MYEPRANMNSQNDHHWSPLIRHGRRHHPLPYIILCSSPWTYIKIAKIVGDPKMGLLIFSKLWIPNVQKFIMSPKEIKIQQCLNIIALEKGFQSNIKLFKHSLFDLSKCFLKWLKVKCFDTLILDLSNGHNLCYMSFIFWKCDLILSITFQKKSNHIEKTKFGQGLIPQTLIQRFGMLKDFQLSKWEFNLGVKGLLPFYSHKVSCFMLECVWTFLHVNLVPCSTWFQLKGFQLFFVSRTFCCLT